MIKAFLLYLAGYEPVKLRDIERRLQLAETRAAVAELRAYELETLFKHLVVPRMYVS